MAVPSGDQRDFEFARAYNLPIVAIQMPPNEWFASNNISPTTDCALWPSPFVGEGTFINSSNKNLSLDGKAFDERSNRAS
jgi:Leucyl-tRNA synthetase